MNKNLKKKKKGFTLVEVIIVLAIIAIIAAIAIPNLTKVRQDSKRKADIQTCESIKRTIDILVTDGTIIYGSGGTITITAGAEPELDTAITVKDSGEIKSYFKDVKDPQIDNGKKYKATLDGDGAVTKVSVVDDEDKETDASISYENEAEEPEKPTKKKTKKIYLNKISRLINKWHIEKEDLR